MTIFVVGEPCSGKSTIVQELSRVLEIPYFSTGIYARNLGMGKEKSIMETDMSLDFDKEIRKEVLRKIKKNKHIVIDGYPRGIDQIKEAERETQGRAMYLFVKVHPSVMIERAKERGRDSNDDQEVLMGRYHASHRLLGLLRGIVGYVRCAIYYQDREAIEFLIRDVRSILK